MRSNRLCFDNAEPGDNARAECLPRDEGGDAERWLGAGDGLLSLIDVLSQAPNASQPCLSARPVDLGRKARANRPDACTRPRPAALVALFWIAFVRLHDVLSESVLFGPG